MRTAKLNKKYENPHYKIITLTDPTSIAAENYRRIKTSLDNLSLEKELQVVQFCSSAKHEGKSITCLNVAATYVEEGKKVLIIDLDFRAPVIHRSFRLPKENGLSEYLLGKLDRKDLIHQTKEGIDVICSGERPAFPSSLINSKIMANLIAELKKEYDYIFIDCPPVLVTVDSITVSSLCDGCLFIVSHQKIKKDVVKEAILTLKKNNVYVLGVVYTQAPTKSQSSYYYYNKYE